MYSFSFCLRKLLREVFDDVFFRLMVKNNDRPIMERIDIEQLKNMIADNLRRDGYDLPFEFCVVDKDGRNAYQSPGYKASAAEKGGSFMQILFDSQGTDAPGMQDRYNYVEVYFPSSQRFLLSSSLNFMLPSFFFHCCSSFSLYLCHRCCFPQQEAERDEERLREQHDA